MILCLGEAIVDLICERELDSPLEADEFRPRFGGALANVAIAASRAGADVGLAGGVGADPWGDWLHSALEAEGVDTSWMSSVEGVATPVVFITFGRDREPRYSIYGEGIAATIGSLEARLEQAIEAADALVLGSNTLVGERERAVTERARELALARDVPLLFDPNLRPARWQDLDEARRRCLAICDGATLVRANLEEARWLSGAGESDAAESAEAVVSLGAQLAAVTRGEHGAVIRGAASADHPGVRVETVSPLGAGDAFMGTLTAGLATVGFDLSRAGDALAPACIAAAEVCTVWRAIV